MTEEGAVARHAEIDPLNARYGYDQWAPFYDDEDPSTWLDEPVVREWTGGVTPGRMLDLGCGTGRYTRTAYGHHRVTGLDLSRGMLARAHARSRQLRGRLVQARAESLPFRSERFDLVLCGLVVDHVRDLSAFFLGVAAVLKPGGLAIVTGVHPEMQRLTGPTIAFEAGGQQGRIGGIIHETVALTEAARHAGLTRGDLRELTITEQLVNRHPAWRPRLGYPALVMLALRKS